MPIALSFSANIFIARGSVRAYFPAPARRGLDSACVRMTGNGILISGILGRTAAIAGGTISLCCIVDYTESNVAGKPSCCDLVIVNCIVFASEGDGSDSL